MRPRTLLDDLRRLGFTLWLENNKIRFKGTRDPLTPELLAELKSNKPDLIRILEDENPAPYKTRFGDLAIPLDSDPRYHWWKPGGRKPSEVREELKRLVN